MVLQIPAPQRLTRYSLLTIPPDKEKNRYFKIEPTANAAPSSAAYTTDNVRKRKAEAQVVTAAAKRLERFEGHIRRAAVLDHPHVGARLVREFGVVDSELPVKTWTRGLRDKGAVPISEDPDAPAIPCMLVNGDDKQSGMGVVYAGMYEAGTGYVFSRGPRGRARTKG